MLDPDAYFCPSWSDLKSRKLAFKQLPLNVHNNVCGVLDLKKLVELEMSEEIKKELLEALRWVQDPKKYDDIPLPPYRQYQARLSDKDITKLSEAGKFVKTTPRCGVKGFSVPEWVKNRRRPIFAPDINQSITKDMLQPNTLPRKEDVREQGTFGQYSKQFDMKSWFDQVPLHIKISRYFSLDGGWCLSTLPMGFRPAVEVAHAIIRALTDFKLPEGVQVAVYIDNIRFVGNDSDAVEEAGAMFKERCAAVGAIIGTETATVQADDFLGEHYDYVKKTRCLTKKMLKKLRFMRDALTHSMPLTFRQVAAFYGALFYTSNVLKLSLANYFNPLRWYRTQMAMLTDWEAAAQQPPPDVRQQLINWIAANIKNKPVDMSEPAPPEFPDLTLYVDASDYGWACMSVSNSSTVTRKAQWSEDDRKAYPVSSSVTSEPLAVVRAVHAVVPKRARYVKVFSDHIGLVYAGNRGYGKGETYNLMIQQLQREYPNVRFIFEHIPGDQNPVDKASRGLE